mgnify:CR=1 FL=1
MRGTNLFYLIFLVIFLHLGSLYSQEEYLVNNSRFLQKSNPSYFGYNSLLKVGVLYNSLTLNAFERMNNKYIFGTISFDNQNFSLGVDINSFKMGSPEDMSNFITAVIHEGSFDKIASFLDAAKKDTDVEIIIGGGHDKTVGYFIEPTVIVCEDPNYESMIEEIFGPVLSIFIYEDSEFLNVLQICDNASPYALTGSIFANEEEDIQTAFKALRFTAGNFYINDKPTGAVVAQQPFGGARASGTNDKAGSPLNLLRWISPRSVKRTLSPSHDWDYPFLQPDE